MLDTIDGWMNEIKPLLKIEDHCYFESDVKPADERGRDEFAAYLIKGDEVFKIILAELSIREMKRFMGTEEFKRHLHQRMDRLAVKAGYRASLVNNDKLDKDFQSE